MGEGLTAAWIMRFFDFCTGTFPRMRYGKNRICIVYIHTTKRINIDRSSHWIWVTGLAICPAYSMSPPIRFSSNTFQPEHLAFDLPTFGQTWISGGGISYQEPEKRMEKGRRMEGLKNESEPSSSFFSFPFVKVHSLENLLVPPVTNTA